MSTARRAPHADAGGSPPDPPSRSEGRGAASLALPAPGSAGPAPLRKHWRWHAGTLAALLLLAGYQSGLWTGDLGARLYLGDDIPICAWLQTRVSENLLRHPWRPFEGNVHYPEPSPVVLANAQLGSALLVTPLRPFTANPVLLDNVGTLLTLIAGGYALFLLAWWLWGDPGAAMVPAIAVTFAAHQVHHLIHLNMLSIFGFPLLLLGIFQILERPRTGGVLLAAGGFAVQVLSCAYYGVAAALLALVVGGCGLGRLHRRRAWGFAAAAAGLAALACWPYLRAFHSLGLQDWGTGEGGVGGIVLRLPADLVRTNAWLWRWGLPERGDSAFAGFAVLALAAWGAYRGFARFHVRTLLLAGLAFLVLSLGRQVELGGRVLTLPYAWLLRFVPLLRAGRHPVSFVVVYLIALGMLAALGARAAGLTRGRGRLALLLAVVALEVLSPPPRRAERPPLPAVYAAVARLQPPGAILELPIDSPDQQLWAAEHELRTANGLLPHAPPQWLTLAQWLHEDLKVQPARDRSDRRSLIYLRARFPVRYLIAHPGTPETWVRNIEATPAVFEPVLETGGARVYRIHRGGRGPRLRRDFRSEDVTHGIDLTLSGPAGLSLAVSEDGTVLARLPLTPEARKAHVALPRRPPGTLVSLELRAISDGDFELLSIEPAS